MKLSSLILFLSALGNVALLGWVVIPNHRATRIDGDRSDLTALKPSKAGLAVNSTSAGLSGSAKLWPALDSTDLKVFAARLREAGFPEDIVKLLVTERIWSEVYRSERRAAINAEPKEYWRSRTPGLRGISSAEMSKRTKTAQRLIEEIFGPAAAPAPDSGIYADYQFGFLSQDKREALRQLMDKMSSRMDTFYGGAYPPGRTPTPEQKAQIEEANKQYETEIEQTLGPEGAIEFKMRQGNAAEVLRQDLKNFRPSESEYRALFAVYDGAIQSQSTGAGSDASQNMGSLQSWIRTSNQAQIQQILGPDRYADLQQAVEPGAAKLNMITERLGLPLSAAAQVSTVEKDIAARAQQVQQDTSLTNEQRAQKISDLQTEAQSSITTTLGDDGYAAYKQYSGSWIDKLKSGPKKR